MAQQSTKTPLPPVKQTEQLMTQMIKLRDDPLKWVMYAYPWGQSGTPLEKIKGPRLWQKEELQRMGDFIQTNHERIRKGDIPKIYHSATVSGRGPGKSAFVAWVNDWHMSTKIGATSIITANTDSQLTNFTFAEVNKWLTLSINGYWWEVTQKMVRPAPWFEKAMKDQLKIDTEYNYIMGKLWDEDNPVAFAGAHNPLGMMVTFDEASGIPQNIWTVSEGFFSDISPYRFWFAFSNPRSNTGAFFECFHKYREYWYTRKIDSRTVEGLDRDHLQSIVDKYGEDSDEARIEVKGEFPKHGDRQFVSRGVVESARTRELERYDDHAALLMGVDPARYGDDATVIRFRRGRDARSIPPIEMKGADNMQVANKCAELIEKFDPDGVFVDSGAGAGIIDRLKEMGYKVFEVGFGTASNDEQYADHRTELWGEMRDWLGGAMIDQSDKLRDDLCGPEFEFAGREDKIKLESKEKMKKRGLSSPDNADALAVTFHAKVARKDFNTSRNSIHRKTRVVKGRDYNPLG